MRGRSVKGLKGPAVGVALSVLAVLASPARAGVVLAESGLITGTEQLQFTFDTTGPGTVDILLADLDWPTPLSELDLSATSPGSMWGSMAGPGELTFKVPSAGTYDANLTGVAQGSLDAGTYSLQVSYTSPVPLPSSGWTLLGGILVLGAALQQRGRLPLSTSS